MSQFLPESGFSVYRISEPHFDLRMAKELAYELRQFRAPMDVVLDLPQVVDFDESAIQALAVCMRRTINRGGCFFVCSPIPDVRARFFDMGVDRVASGVYSDVDDVLAQLSDTHPLAGIE